MLTRTAQGGSGKIFCKGQLKIILTMYLRQTETAENGWRHHPSIPVHSDVTYMEAHYLFVLLP